MTLFLAIICFAAMIGLNVLKKMHATRIKQMRGRAQEKGFDDEKIERVLAGEEFPIPTWSNAVLGTAGAVLLGVYLFNFMFFYAQPMYKYHVRTMFNQERVIDGIGWSYYGGGKYESWKKAISIQAAANTGASDTDQVSGADNSISANILPQNIVFLDNVDADASATARFRLPSDDDTFLKLAHEYRNPSNFLRTALIPAFKETLQATASLMSAEEYFAGARTEFASEFENQMIKGIYLVHREEFVVSDGTQHTKGSANAAKDDKQDPYGDNQKVVFKVVKVMQDDGITPVRKKQTFVNYGVDVIEARIPNMDPNSEFIARMQKKQKASADRAIARESRIQEEEQKLLAVAKGEREVAERQAIWKADQIEQTTKAETDKQLAITQASKLKAKADIDKQTADILLEKANVDAKAIVVLAEAEATERKLKILADNGLKLKIDAIVEMNAANATAFAKRQVPSTVVYSGGNSTGQLGSSDDMQTVVTSQMLKNLKALDIDMNIKR